MLPDHEGTILNAEYIPKYNYLVTSAADMKVRFWDVPNDYDLHHTETMQSSQTVLKYSEQYNMLFTASRTGRLHYWNYVEEGDKQSTFLCSNESISMHSDVIMDVLIVPNQSNRIITSSLDSTIKIYDLEKNETVHVLHGHKQGVVALAWSEDYEFLVSAGSEHEPLVWLANVGSENPFKLRDPRRPHQHALVGAQAVRNRFVIIYFVVTIYNASPQIITADHKGVIKIWDIRTFQCIQTIYSEKKLNDKMNDFKNFYLNSFVYMEPYKQVVTAGRQNLQLYEYNHSQYPECADDSPIVFAHFNECNNSFLTSAGRDVKVWDATNGCISQTFHDILDEDITCMCLDDKGQKFIAGTHDGEVSVFNSMNGNLIKKYKAHQSEVTSLSYCKETKLFISTSWDKSIRVNSDRNIGDNTTVRDFKGYHQADIKCSAVSSKLLLFLTAGMRYKQLKLISL